MIFNLSGRWSMFFLLILTLVGCTNKEERVCPVNLYFPVVQEGKWGAIDHNGKLRIPLNYDWLYFNRYENGIMLAEVDSVKIIIDLDGNVLLSDIPYSFTVQIKCDSTFIFNEQKERVEVYLVEELSKSSRKEHECKCYEEPFEQFHNTLNEDYYHQSNYQCGLAFVVSRNFWGYLNKEGKKIWTVENLPLREFILWQESQNVRPDDKFDRILEDAFAIQNLIDDLNGCNNKDFAFPHFQRREIRM
jgi:hypothetical protein